MSNLLSIRAKRGLAAGVATAVGAVALTTVAGAPAQAAPTGSLTWGVSQQFIDHLSTPTLSPNVTFADNAFTFPEASASVSAGTTTINYTGSVKRAFINGGTEYYSVTVADPRVVVEADGDATLSAVVSSANAAQGPNPAASVDPVRVTVLEVPTTGSLAGGFTAAASLDFAADFFNGLVPGVQAHFKQTSVAVPPVEQPKKRPMGFTATGTAETVTPKITVQEKVTGTTASLAVTGTGFTGGNADYTGVYLGVAPVGGLPDVGSLDAMDGFVASAWVTAGAIDNGAFTRNLPVDLTKLTKGTSYALYTWQAHKHSTTALDTVTALSIAKPVVNPPQPPVVKATAKAKVTWAKKPTAKKAGKVKVTIAKAKGKAAATGKAKVILKVGKKTKKITVKVKNGKVTFKAPKGTKRVVVKYLGDSNYKKVNKTLKR